MVTRCPFHKRRLRHRVSSISTRWHFLSKKLNNRRNINGEKVIVYAGKKRRRIASATYVSTSMKKECLSVMVLSLSFISWSDCKLSVHHRCLDAVTLPCQSHTNFSADRIRAAFLRCWASLLFNYRKHLEPVPVAQRKDSNGKLFDFKMAGFLRATSKDSSAYLEMLAETQAFNEFIMERCLKTPDDMEIALFDQIILAKRNRGRHGLFQKQSIPSSYQF